MENTEVFLEAIELKKLNDQQLHNKMVWTSQRERELSAQMISMVAEAAKRRFYLDLGFGTLHEYMTIGLKYSAGSAQRRISAARIMEEAPEVKAQILNGSLTLSKLAQVERFFRNEEMNDNSLSLDEKKTVLQQLENKSSREADRTLLQMSSAPEQLQPEKIKPMSAGFTQVTLNANSEFMDLLEESRGLLGHQLPGASMAEVLAEMMRLGLIQLKKKRFKVKADDIDSDTWGKASQLPSAQISRTVSERVSAATAEAVSKQVQETKAKESETAVVVSNVSINSNGYNHSNHSDVGNSVDSGYIPHHVKRDVYERDQGRCVVLNPRTSKPCGKRGFLEFDHFPIPRAKGGPSTVSNLRLSCRACNRLHAVQVYGRAHVVKQIERRP
jgi:hypothetical protein